MKKLLLSIFAVLFAASVSAQAVQIFYEDFTGIEGTTFEDELYPKGWRTYYGGMSNWRIGTGASWAGGIAPELMFVYQPTFFGITYLSLPPLDLTGYERVTISFVQNYNNGLAEVPPTLGIATTLDEWGSDDSWIFADDDVHYTSGVSERVVVELSPEHVGNPEVIVAICLIIRDSNFTAWSFDNIEVTGYTPDAVAEDKARFNVYPNPAYNVLNIECDNDSEVSIFNLLGVTVKEAKLSKGQNTLAIDELAEGAYFIQTRDSKGNTNTSKFIVRK